MNRCECAHVYLRTLCGVCVCVRMKVHVPVYLCVYVSLCMCDVVCALIVCVQCASMCF